MSDKKVWFFDDDMANAPSVSNPTIHFIKVNSSGKHGHHGDVSGYFSEKLKGTQFEKIMIPDEMMDPASGITEQNMLDLKKAAMKGTVIAAVFDWDRTLTMVEGLFSPVDKQTNTVNQYKTQLANKYGSMKGFDSLTDKEVAQYFFHKPSDGDTSSDVSKRPNAVGALLRDLQSMKIPIFVLTNNPTARVNFYNKADSRMLFVDILNQIGVTIPKDNVIYNTLRNKEKMIMTVILPKVTGSPAVSLAKPELVPFHSPPPTATPQSSGVVKAKPSPYGFYSGLGLEDLDNDEMGGPGNLEDDEIGGAGDRWAGGRKTRRKQKPSRKRGTKKRKTRRRVAQKKRATQKKRKVNKKKVRKTRRN